MEEEIPQEQPTESWITIFNSPSKSKDDKLSLFSTSQLMGLEKDAGWGLQGGASYDLESASKYDAVGKLLKFGGDDMSVLDPLFMSMSKEQRDELAEDIGDIIDSIRSKTAEFFKKSLRCDYTSEILKEKLGILLESVKKPVVDI